jgi:hypothetical protein
MQGLVLNTYLQPDDVDDVITLPSRSARSLLRL